MQFPSNIWLQFLSLRNESQALWRSVAESLEGYSQALVAGAITEDEAAEACQLRKLGNFTSVTSVIKNLPRLQQQVAECYLGLGIMFDNPQVVYKMTPIPHGAMEVAHLFQHKPKKTLTCKSCKEMCKGCKGSGAFHLRSFMFQCFNDIHSMFQRILPPFCIFCIFSIF